MSLNKAAPRKSQSFILSLLFLLRGSIEEQGSTCLECKRSPSQSLAQKPLSYEVNTRPKSKLVIISLSLLRTVKNNCPVVLYKKEICTYGIGYQHFEDLILTKKGDVWHCFHQEDVSKNF